VAHVLYDCTPITAPTVRVVLNSQLLEGVDNYFSLKNGTTLYSFGPLLSEGLASYIKAAGTMTGAGGRVCACQTCTCQAGMLETLNF
jgi:hypothetical protein